MNGTLVRTSDRILQTIDADLAAAAGGGGVMAPGLLPFGNGFGAGCFAFEPELLVDELEEEEQVSDAVEEPEWFPFLFLDFLSILKSATTLLGTSLTKQMKALSAKHRESCLGEP